jgi:hypothetical protein
MDGPWIEYRQADRNCKMQWASLDDPWALDQEQVGLLAENVHNGLSILRNGLTIDSQSQIKLRLKAWPVNFYRSDSWERGVESLNHHLQKCLLLRGLFYRTFASSMHLYII